MQNEAAVFPGLKPQNLVSGFNASLKASSSTEPRFFGQSYGSGARSHRVLELQL